MVDDGGNHNDDEDDMVDDNFVDGDDAAGPQHIYILNLVELKKLTLKSAKSCRTKKADSKNC